MVVVEPTIETGAEDPAALRIFDRRETADLAGESVERGLVGEGPGLERNGRSQRRGWDRPSGRLPARRHATLSDQGDIRLPRRRQRTCIPIVENAQRATISNCGDSGSWPFALMATR